MQMIEAANKIASDKLHRLEQAEIARLRRTGWHDGRL